MSSKIYFFKVYYESKKDFYADRIAGGNRHYCSGTKCDRTEHELHKRGGKTSGLFFNVRSLTTGWLLCIQDNKGLLYPYVTAYDIYRCPVAKKTEFCTYS